MKFDVFGNFGLSEDSPEDVSGFGVDGFCLGAEGFDEERPGFGG